MEIRHRYFWHCNWNKIAILDLRIVDENYTLFEELIGGTEFEN